ncbi:MAG: AmmeMemoRadiSam system protein B [Deltaproteobacteria bacterium]|nr:AmmeMemoRadiSam system protein B [Deltaproteobacteria bacterium]
MSEELPKLRSRLEAIPIRRGRELYIALRDLEGLNPETLLLSPQAYFLVTLLDGSSSPVDIQAAYMRKFGDILFREDLDGLLQQLNTHFFLDNENSRVRMEQLITEFHHQPTRPAYHAGLSYEKNPEELRVQLKSYFAPENGGPGDPNPTEAKRTIAGVMAPHIDLRSGGPCFAYAYKALVEASAFHTCVVLGTGHEPLPHYFALSRKDFETPLGSVTVDHEFVEELSSRCRLDLLADEFAHRREHTIEFQALFLRLLLPEVRIVPLLCSFGVEEIEQRTDDVQHLVQALKETLDHYPQPVCLLSSVDLAHIGPRYGDSFKPHGGTVREHNEADHRLLEIVSNADAEAFAHMLVRERNQRRICGLPPIYTMLKTLEGTVKGELLRYDYTKVDNEGSFVTFASLALYKNVR